MLILMRSVGPDLGCCGESPPDCLLSRTLLCKEHPWEHQPFTWRPGGQYFSQEVQIQPGWAGVGGQGRWLLAAPRV